MMSRNFPQQTFYWEFSKNVGSIASQKTLKQLFFQNFYFTHKNTSVNSFPFFFFEHLPIQTTKQYIFIGKNEFWKILMDSHSNENRTALALDRKGRVC